ADQARDEVGPDVREQPRLSEHVDDLPKRREVHRAAVLAEVPPRDDDPDGEPQLEQDAAQPARRDARRPHAGISSRCEGCQTSTLRSRRANANVIASPSSPLVTMYAYIVGVSPAYCALKIRSPSPGRPTISSVPMPTSSAYVAEIRSPVAMYGVAPGSDTKTKRIARFSR